MLLTRNARPTAARPPHQDPIRPVATLSFFLLSLIVAAFIGLGVLTVVQVVLTGHSNVTWGSDDCVQISDIDTMAASDPTGHGIAGFDHRAGSYLTNGYQVCLNHPTGSQWLALAAPSIAEMLLLMGSLLLVVRISAAARNEGLFSPATARRARWLGWVLMFWAVPFTLVAAYCRGVVAGAVIPDFDTTANLIHPGISWALLFMATGVVSIARVLHRAVPLQEEVDATV